MARIIPLTVIYICLFFSFVFGEQPDIKKIAKDPTLCAGMNREELLKVYPQQYLQSDDLRQDDEVLVFDDYLSEAAGDTITFYLKYGKVTWLTKDKANPTPEERLEAIRKRSQFQQPAMKQDNIQGTIADIKVRDHLQDLGRDDRKKYMKEHYR